MAVDSHFEVSGACQPVAQWPALKLTRAPQGGSA